MMITAQNPCIGLTGSWNLGDDVVYRFDVPSGHNFEMHSRRTYSDVVGQRQRATPLRRGHRTSKRLQQRLCISIGDWQYGNLRNGLCIFAAQALGIGGGANSRSEWIAGVAHEIHHAAALHAISWTHWTFGEYWLFEVAIVARVGINETAYGAVFISELRLHAAPGIPVFGDDDCALHGDAQALQAFIILGQPVIDEHERRGYISVSRVRVVGRQLFRIA